MKKHIHGKQFYQHQNMFIKFQVLLWCKFCTCIICKDDVFLYSDKEAHTGTSMFITSVGVFIIILETNHLICMRITLFTCYNPINKCQTNGSYHYQIMKMALFGLMQSNKIIKLTASSFTCNTYTQKIHVYEFKYKKVDLLYEFQVSLEQQHIII